MDKRTDSLIKQYCGSINKRIDACGDKDVALILKDYFCWEFQQKCKSEIILNFLENQVNQIIEKKFKTL